MRLVPNHAAQIKRSETVTFTFDGRQFSGHAGESLVSALLAAGELNLRLSPIDTAPRGAFCCMGLCQECAVRINGRTVEACRTPVVAGLVVERIV